MTSVILNSFTAGKVYTEIILAFTKIIPFPDGWKHGLQIPRWPRDVF